MLQAHQLMGLGCRVLSAQGECISPDFVSKFLAGSCAADHDEHLVTKLRLLGRNTEYDVDVEYDEDEFDFITVSGWVIHEFDRIPQNQDSFDYKNLHVTVTKADQRKVNEIKVEIREDSSED